tara:strand:+ start:1846 stop:2088 length:243 start_codon:yes stop_codon:yes gene_type:complete
MKQSKDFFEKLGKFVEKTVINYKDLSSEIVNICKSKRDEFIYKLKITSKEETEILKKRIDKIEKRLEFYEKKKVKKAKRR